MRSARALAVLVRIVPICERRRPGRVSRAIGPKDRPDRRRRVPSTGIHSNNHFQGSEKQVHTKGHKALKGLKVIRDQVDDGSCGDGGRGREGEAFAIYERDQTLVSPCAETEDVEGVVVVEGECIPHSLLGCHVGIAEKTDHISSRAKLTLQC